MKKVIQLVILGSIFMLTGCASSTAEEIEVNKDKIPSVYKVLGEKKIVGTNSSVKDSVRTTEITYQSGSISKEEVLQYISYLRENEDFLVTLDTKVVDDMVMNQLGKESETEGDIVLVDVAYPNNLEGKVVITYRSGKGEISVN
ncbi:hypothetical protein ACYSNR_12950 [Enterococcus sp. LJL128]|uniref:hypothetical protein n=1 Tax=Enterococcus sp. LJL51 TaxID=3416656 RepID=UPI003CEFD844